MTACDGERDDGKGEGSGTGFEWDDDGAEVRGDPSRSWRRCARYGGGSGAKRTRFRVRDVRRTAGAAASLRRGMSADKGRRLL